MQIKSDINTANEQNKKIKTNVETFSKFTNVEISAGNIDSIDAINEIASQLKETLSRYKDVAQRDGENILLLAEEFGKVDEAYKKD